MASRSSTRPRTLPPRHQPEQRQQQQQQLRAKWTTPLTEVLVDLMVDEVRKGNKLKYSFSKKTWTSISDNFYKKTGLFWDKEQLMNRFAVLKRQYSIVKLLIEQNDFRWDQTTGFITAEAEVWNRFIKEHPDAETVKTNGCAIYPQLSVIFSEPGTNGVSYGHVQIETLSPEPLSIFKMEPLSEPENYLNEDDKFRSLISTNSRKRGRKGVDCAVAEAILEMASASRLRAAAIRKYNDRFTVRDCVRILNEMKEVDQRVYNTAIDMFNSRYAREIFLSLEVGKRFDWLHNKCSVQSV